MREPEPFERPPRQKIDRPPGSYDAIKFDGPCGLAGCGFDRKHYHPRWWVEQKEPRIEIPISMADPGAPMTAKPIPVPHRLKMATESALGTLPPATGSVIYLDRWSQMPGIPWLSDEAMDRDEAAGYRVVRVYDRGVKFTPPAGATVTHHDGPCGRKDCSHSVPHHHAEFENTSCIWFDKPNYEQSPISVRVEYDEKLFREGILKIQNELRARRAQPEVRSTYRLPARISRRRRLVGWAMLAATAAGWIVRLL